MTRGIYRFSGGFSTTALMLAITASAAALAGLAAAYLLAIDHFGAAPIAPLAVVIAAATLGAAAASTAVRWRKMRSRTGILLTVLSGGAIGLAVGWGLRAHALEAIAMASPPAIAQALRDAAGRALSLGPIDVSGDALRWLWVSELMLASAVVVAIARRAARAPLCPYCRRWCKREYGVTRLAAVSVDDARARLSRGDYASLAGLGQPGRGRALRIDLARCTGCQHTNALSMYVERRWRADATVVENLLLGGDALRTVRRLARAS